MTRVLVKTYRDPLHPPRPARIAAENLVGNNGNLLFSDAAVKALSVEGTDVTCWTAGHMQARPDEVNESFDHVVLPLASALRPDYRTRLRELTTFVSRLRIPVTVLGVGAQGGLEGDYGQLDDMREEIRAFCAAVLDRSPSIGVRGEMTAGLLRGLGFPEVEVIGCPSMFWHGPDLPEPRLGDPGDDPRLAINLKPGVPLPPDWVTAVLTDHARLTYFPQDRADMSLMMWGDGDAVAGDAGFPHRLGHPLFRDHGARFHVDAETWVDDLRDFDLSIGTRIHGNVVAVLAGVPAHVLVHDARTRELADYFEVVRTPAREIERLDPRDPFGRHDWQAVVRGHGGRFGTYRAYLEAHGLPHRWAPEARPTWEPLRAGVAPQPPVVVEQGRAPEVWGQLSWLKWIQQRDAERWRTRARRLDGQVRRQGLRLDRQARRLKDAEARLAALEAPVERPGPARRALRTAAATAGRRRPRRT